MYELPFARNNKYLGGWQIGGIGQIDSGFDEILHRHPRIREGFGDSLVDDLRLCISVSGCFAVGTRGGLTADVQNSRPRQDLDRPVCIAAARIADEVGRRRVWIGRLR